MQIQKQNNFDFLRLLASIGVLFGHCFVLTGKKPDWLALSLWQIEEVCLYIFFTISGYLVTASFHNSEKSYLKNRCLRIFPALVVNVLLVSLLASLFLKQFYIPYLYNILPVTYVWEIPGLFSNNPSLMANGSLWTLGHEFLLYIMVLIIGKSCIGFKKAIPALIITGMALLAFKVNSFYGLSGPNFQIMFLPDLNLLLFFLTGAAFYLFVKSYNIPTLIISAIAATILCLTGFHNYGLLAFLPYAIFYIAFNKHIPLNKTSRYGDFSYGMYIYAYPLQQVIIQITGNNISIPALFACSLALSLFFAFLSWHLIEKQALKLKTRSIRVVT